MIPIYYLAESEDKLSETFNSVVNSALGMFTCLIDIHSSPSVSLHIDPDCVREVKEYVHVLNHKWFHLGLSLGLHYSTLKNIETSHYQDVGDHMTDMLAKWLNGVDLETTIDKGVSGPRSWRSLALALDCPLVRERTAALKIQEQHQI